MPGRKKTRTTSKPKRRSAAKPTKRGAIKKAPPKKKPAAAKGKTGKSPKTRKAPSSSKKKAARKQLKAPRSPRDVAPSRSVAHSATVPSVPNSARVLAPPLSERAIAVSSQLPLERPLTDEEQDAMMKVAMTAQRFIGAAGSPESIVKKIGVYVDDIRRGTLREPRSQDVRLGLGVLWGEQLRSLVGWRWVHLTYPDGFASYALVPEDRSFACFPLNRLQDLMRPSSRANTSVRLFESIRDEALPSRRQKAYLVIG